ncbi:MAG: FtsX-like permease family protein [Candidatus Aminicenantes bacterium]|nr:FtsX-like permease family protein [Candidatus Aminicenantes bacterium]
MLLKLAVKNILGAGLRSWLSAFVISLALVIVVWNQGILIGFDRQASKDMVDAEYGGGQVWQPAYDPQDLLTFEFAHGPVPEALEGLIAEGRATAILVAQASIYPNGRMRTVVLKGIDPLQKTVVIPSSSLAGGVEDEVPVLLGNRMAKATGLSQGDTVTIRWREPGGSFNALDGRIVALMTTTVPTIDLNILWVPLDRLRAMTRLEGEATYIVLSPAVTPPAGVENWVFKSPDDLLQDIRQLYKTKSIGRNIMFVLLLSLGMLAVFDTQVLSIFRRRKEMGTLMALGFTRGMVIRLFTLEGTLHGVLAAILGAIYGLPLLFYVKKIGFAIPQNWEGFGFALGDKIFPVYGAGLILGTTALVLAVTAVVSFLPTRKIAKLKATDALRGRFS